MLRLTSGLLICLFSNAIYAELAPTVGETIIPGYTPPRTEVESPSTTPTIMPVPEEKPSAESRQDVIRPTNAEVIGTVKVDHRPVLSEDEKEAWQTYLLSLRTCAPGTYVLRQINPVLFTQFGKIETNKIIGLEGDVCAFTTMYYAENDPRLSPRGGINSRDEIVKYPAGLECRFPRPSIEIMIAMYTDFLAGKEIKPSDTDPFSKALADQCNAFIMIDGEKTLVNPNL